MQKLDLSRASARQSPEIIVKDQIIEILDGSEPIDALNVLFSAIYAVASANGVSEFTLSSLFSSNIEAQFEIDAEVAEEEKDEQTDE
jgi:hypothetical protein